MIYDQFKDADLACIAKLKNLKWFLGFRGVTNKGMARLADLTKMERLTIGGPKLTNKALGHLKDMKGLDVLNIHGGNFTDAGLVKLEGLKALRFLRFNSNNRFSDAGLLRLKSKLPNLYSLEPDVEEAVSKRQPKQSVKKKISR